MTVRRQARIRTLLKRGLTRNEIRQKMSATHDEINEATRGLDKPPRRDVVAAVRELARRGASFELVKANFADCLPVVDLMVTWERHYAEGNDQALSDLRQRSVSRG